MLSQLRGGKRVTRGIRLRQWNSFLDCMSLQQRDGEVTRGGGERVYIPVI